MEKHALLVSPRCVEISHLGVFAVQIVMGSVKKKNKKKELRVITLNVEEHEVIMKRFNSQCLQVFRNVASLGKHKNRYGASLDVWRSHLGRRSSESVQVTIARNGVNEP